MRKENDSSKTSRPLTVVTAAPSVALKETVAMQDIHAKQKMFAYWDSETQVKQKYISHC